MKLKRFLAMALKGACLAFVCSLTPTIAQPLPPLDATQGEVRKVDKEAKKLTIKHGEIKNLDMPPMTMVFQIKDPLLLDKVKPGDKIQFHAAKENGSFIVTDLIVQ
jgi:Cu(I)/Ag(I) efflux system periplasmic protein CusF